MSFSREEERENIEDLLTGVNQSIRVSWILNEPSEMKPNHLASNSRHLYRSAVFKGYLERILEKSDKNPVLLDEFHEYLYSGDWVPKEERDSRRSAPEKIKQELPDECVCCDRDDEKCIEYHHIVPHSKGGATEKWNLMPLCSDCHKIVEFQFFIQNREIFKEYVDERK